MFFPVHVPIDFSAVCCFGSQKTKVNSKTLMQLQGKSENFEKQLFAE